MSVYLTPQLSQFRHFSTTTTKKPTVTNGVVEYLRVQRNRQAALVPDDQRGPVTVDLRRDVALQLPRHALDGLGHVQGGCKIGNGKRKELNLIYCQWQPGSTIGFRGKK